MSLVSDTNYLIHRLRLSYLREIEDPYGPRIITLDQAYNSNPFVIAASLADAERWPELALPVSPGASEDEAERPSGFPGARLKYTQTIMGGRSGGLGMRVQGKRSSLSKRFRGTSSQLDIVKGDSTVPEDSISTSAPVVSSQPATSSPIEKPTGSSSLQQSLHVQVQEPTVVEDVPLQKVVQFLPKFKHSAEMERRRRARMAARRSPGPVQAIDFSSSDEESQLQDNSSSEGDFESNPPELGSIDDGDSFDLEYSTVPADNNSDSDMLSFSGDTNSVSTSSGHMSSSQVPGRRSRPVRLSPVSEGELSTDSRSCSQFSDSLARVSFEMVTSGPSSIPNDGRKTNNRVSASRGRSSQNLSISSISTATPDNYFVRKQVEPIKPMKSSLTAMLASADTTSNPFSELYAAISGRGGSTSVDVVVYFPHAAEPKGRPMGLNVRKDTTVEELIGFALWTYWKERWLPKIDEGLSGEDDPRWETKVSAVGWILRIAEEDGEVDDDFPPPDRLGKILKFNADAYAVMEANLVQVQQNQLIESKIQRHPSRMAKKAENLANPIQNSLAAASSSSTLLTSTFGSVPLSTSLSPGSGPPIFLRIRVGDMTDITETAHISTTIPATTGMYMQEALELVCRKRKLPNPNDYALLLGDKSILIPLDRTVASLQGKRELVLIKRSLLPQIGDILKLTGKTTDPNASIFSKRISDTPDMQYASLGDYTAGYKKYTIYRKTPMLLARQERTLAIDGVYIHIMPSSNKAKAVFDSIKTSSYHIKSIADCLQSAKTSSFFKLVLSRGPTNKRYDFEAESPKLAGEIVQTIKSLKASLDRSGTVAKSRRSRQVS